MKKSLLIIIMATLASSLAFSQVDITPTYGYNFGAQISSYSGGMKMKGAETFGIKMDAMRDDGSGIQFAYSYTSSRINITDNTHPGGGFNRKFADITENYYLLGVIRKLETDGIVEPYGVLNLGAAYYNLTNVDSYYYLSQTDALRFAFGLCLGAKIMFSEKVGLDMHIRALAPISYGGVGIGIGTGGVSSGVYAGSTFISGDVGGGIIIRLGN